MSSHLLSGVEQICERIVVLSAGRLIADARVEELRREEVLAVTGTPLARARDVARRVAGVLDAEERDGWLCVRIQPGTSADLNDALVSSGIRVGQLYPTQRSLEEIFLEMTGCEHHAGRWRRWPLVSGAISAEPLKLRRRPATWVVLAVLTLFVLVFGYLLLWVLATTAPEEAFGGGPPPTELLDALRPANLSAYAASNATGVGGALALVLGGLVAGSEYSWGTVRTIAVVRPRRHTIEVAKSVAVTVAAAVLGLVGFAAAGFGAWIVATAEGMSGWPPAGDVIRSAGASWLILTASAQLGLVLGFLTTTPAARLGSGSSISCRRRRRLAAARDRGGGAGDTAGATGRERPGRDVRGHRSGDGCRRRGDVDRTAPGVAGGGGVPRGVRRRERRDLRPRDDLLVGRDALRGVRLGPQRRHPPCYFEVRARRACSATSPIRDRGSR